MLVAAKKCCPGVSIFYTTQQNSHHHDLRPQIRLLLILSLLFPLHVPFRRLPRIRAPKKKERLIADLYRRTFEDTALNRQRQKITTILLKIFKTFFFDEHFHFPFISFQYKNVSFPLHQHKHQTKLSFFTFRSQ